MKPALLLAVSSYLLVLADAQGITPLCQNSYIFISNADEACRTALGYVPQGNPLVPLRQSFSDSSLDTLCSAVAPTNCRTLFLNYVRECITATTISGTPEVGSAESIELHPSVV